MYSAEYANHELAQLLITTATSWGLALTDDQLARFAQYAHELLLCNEKINLTAITEPEAIYRRHFLDSLSCARFWGDTPIRLIDIGSGAGFPGIPLKILRPELHLTLVESVGKKAAFLEHITRMLYLDHVRILSARAEEVGRDSQHREHYDVAVVRAVADLRVLAEYCLPLVRVGGRMLAPKSLAAHAEIDAANSAIQLLGGNAPYLENVTIPGLETRLMVVVTKALPTPAAYPRAVGVPAKKPLDPKT
ncbi:16S rRNA (guanine(527)-N(7))-methyltransferase RsmG [Candidatus Gracilibacteria bacterium]|nr:16S rRNA (guanine(527)-N(7))-methyltransferase RsmG [Candidatus Gracilibacteria bacterium]